MSLERNVARLGEVFNKAGNQLSSNYAFGSAFFAARVGALNLHIEMSTGSGGPDISNFIVKLQGRYSSSTSWQDLMTLDIETGTSSVEHTYTSLPAQSSTDAYGPLNIDPRAYPGGLRIGVKVTNTPDTNDRVIVNAALG